LVAYEKPMERIPLSAKKKFANKNQRKFSFFIDLLLEELLFVSYPE